MLPWICSDGDWATCCARPDVDPHRGPAHSHQAQHVATLGSPPETRIGPPNLHAGIVGKLTAEEVPPIPVS
jgi:hypothetical protein